MNPKFGFNRVLFPKFGVYWQHDDYVLLSLKLIWRFLNFPLISKVRGQACWITNQLPIFLYAVHNDGLLSIHMEVAECFVLSHFSSCDVAQCFLSHFSARNKQPSKYISAYFFLLFCQYSLASLTVMCWIWIRNRSFNFTTVLKFYFRWRMRKIWKFLAMPSWRAKWNLVCRKFRV